MNVFITICTIIMHCTYVHIRIRMYSYIGLMVTLSKAFAYT